MGRAGHRVSDWLRRARLLGAVDQARFLRSLLRSRKANREFRRLHPAFSVPPADLAFDAYDHTSWQAYHDAGLYAARFIAQTIQRHLPGPGLRICEWGCGPARVVRHLHEALGDPRAVLFGTDYNRRSIAWCRRNVAAIEFHENGLEPPLPFASGFLDCVYALSVFTHLARENQLRWIAELLRVIHDRGIVIFTTHGEACLPILLPEERRAFEAGELVVRGHVTEGKKSFAAFHPQRFVREALLQGAVVLEQLPPPTQFGLSQEVWVVAKPRA